jgi:hypothetical protein
VFAAPSAFHAVPKLSIVHGDGATTCLPYLSAADAGGAQLHTVGLLVVEATVPGSPADCVLEPGDVLVRVQGQVRVLSLST